MGHVKTANELTLETNEDVFSSLLKTAKGTSYTSSYENTPHNWL